MDSRKRVIIDFTKLTPDLLALLVKKYPEGYDDHHIIKFKNAKNQWIEAVHIDTEEVIYLVKVSIKLAVTMEKYDVDDYLEFDVSDPNAIQDPEL
ncbi:MAG: hypothetical protein ACI9O8_001462 [Patiriisocius sp.]|jgi:hypothetical protein